MRKWNKLLAMLLAMVMVFGLAATSFAADEDKDDTAPVTDTENTEDEAEDEDKTEAEDEDKTDAEDEDKTEAEDEDKTDAEGEDKTDAEDEDKTDAEDEDKTDAEDEDKTDDAAPVEIDYTGVEEWAKDSITKVVGELGLIVNRETGLEPAATMTRGEMVDALYKLAGSPEVEGENKFVDVADDAFYKDAVLWAVSNEIVNGVSAAHFDPDGALERQQIAVFLYRYAKYAGVDVTVEDDALAGFPDAADVETWAEVEMNWAVANKMINGSDKKLVPADPAQRQMVAAILDRYITNILDAAEAPADDDASEPTDDAAEPADDAAEPADDAAEPTEDEDKTDAEDEDKSDNAEGEDAAGSTEGETEGDDAASDNAGDGNADDAGADEAGDAE